MQDNAKVSREDAKEQVRKVCARLALLHISFAKVLVDELGEEKGTAMVTKAIKKYGTYIGENARKKTENHGLNNAPENYASDLPAYGMHDSVERFTIGNEKRLRAHGCVMGRLWRELGEDKLGRLYCYIDPAKYMAYNSDYKLVHLKALPDGDDYCEFTVKRTTDKDKEDYTLENTDWKSIDK